jgi:hypothetical protein
MSNAALGLIRSLVRNIRAPIAAVPKAAKI